MDEKLREALADLLCCPSCGGSLTESTESGTEDGEAAICSACAARYPVHDGVLDFLTPPSHDGGRER